MTKIDLTLDNGKTIQITEEQFLRNALGYLRKHSPNRVKIIAEEVNLTGQPEQRGAMAMMLLKNPEEVRYYTNTLPLKKEADK